MSITADSNLEILVSEAYLEGFSCVGDNAIEKTFKRFSENGGTTELTIVSMEENVVKIYREDFTEDNDKILNENFIVDNFFELNEAITLIGIP